MKRDLSNLQAQYDVVIVGGGIYGATLLWEATLRGLSCLLVEKQDFGAGTSSNSLKTVHGGIRYLQHGNIKRMRRSSNERRILMKTAPHLVHPLPILLPTYGHGMKGAEIMRLGLLANDILSLDRNRRSDPQKHIKAGKIIALAEAQELIPGLDPDGLTGAALFYDAQLYNSERHVLAYIQSAVEQGAHALNYAPVVGFTRAGDAVTGVTVHDTLNGDELAIGARLVINASGPWVDRLLQPQLNTQIGPKQKWSLAINIVTRRLFEEFAVGLSSKATFDDQDALIKRGSRLYFVAPWRKSSLVGTEYYPFEGHPDDPSASDEQVHNFLMSFNEAYPAAELTEDDIHFVHRGVLPMYHYDEKTQSAQLNKVPTLTDHRKDGIDGIVSVLGVKYTTARAVAQETMDWVYKQIWSQPAPSSQSSQAPLIGGDIENFLDYLTAAGINMGDRVPQRHKQQLVYNYGTQWSAVLAHYQADADDEYAVLRAQTRYAVQHEMAQHLSDVVFRRTELASAGYPGHEPLLASAQTMAAELGWSDATLHDELAAVYERFYHIEMPITTAERTPAGLD